MTTTLIAGPALDAKIWHRVLGRAALAAVGAG